MFGQTALTHNQSGCTAAMGSSFAVSVLSSLGTKNAASLSRLPLAGLLVTKTQTTIPSHRVARHVTRAGFSSTAMRQQFHHG